MDESAFGGRLTFDVTYSGPWITRSWRIRLPIVWGREHWMANSHNAAAPEIVLSVEGVPMERQGVVTGVVRIPADSAARDSTDRGPGVEH